MGALLSGAPAWIGPDATITQLASYLNFAGSFYFEHRFEVAHLC